MDLSKNLKNKENELLKMYFEITQEEYKQMKLKNINDDNFIWYIFKSNDEKIKMINNHIKMIQEIKAIRNK